MTQHFTIQPVDISRKSLVISQDRVQHMNLLWT